MSNADLIKRGRKATDTIFDELADALEETERHEFKRGYLIACANLINGWDRPEIAKHLIGELGIESFDDLKSLDLTDYDLEALRKAFPEESHDANR
jgi:hypothetical protein